MLFINSKIDTKPGWSNNEENRWADYIELMCLRDQIVTPSDLLDIWGENDLDNELDRGGEDHLLKSNETEGYIINYFELLKYRQSMCGDYYPFYIDNELCLSCEDSFTDKQKQYIFLLVCSSIYFMEKTDLHKYTRMFERYCKTIMTMLVPENSIVEIFGTSRDTDALFSGKSLRQRIEAIAKHLHLNTTKTFDNTPRFDKSKGGDGGIDIVTFLPIDKAQYIPFAFGQCTCSYDKWKDKQNSISFDDWTRFLEPLAPYPEFMFVPFPYQNKTGLFDDATSIRSFLIDRLRIICLLRKKDDSSINDSLKEIFEPLSVEDFFE